jgi:hypothetical protein
MRTVIFVSCLVLANAATAFADTTVAFLGPAGWSHNPPPTAVDPARTIEEWHIAGDIATVTYIKDTTTSYDDAMAAIKKNIATNGIKMSADKDVPCHGATGHVVEFAFGPDGHRVITNRLLVPAGSGVDTITYARSDGSTFDSDVKKAETEYCGATP